MRVALLLEKGVKHFFKKRQSFCRPSKKPYIELCSSYKKVFKKINIELVATDLISYVHGCSSS
jgi:hypothetical protein